MNVVAYVWGQHSFDITQGYIYERRRATVVVTFKFISLEIKEKEK